MERPHQPTAISGPEETIDTRRRRRMHVLYGRKMRERRIFLDELTARRRKKEKEMFKKIMRIVGPNWYQVLSLTQRKALDSLEHSIFHDLLEGTPNRSANVLKKLGLYKTDCPNRSELMNCIYRGREDPKVMLAQVFLLSYDHEFQLKERSYSLCAKLILSAIYYLGLKNLKQLLKERFKAEPMKEKSVIRKAPRKQPPLISPYFERMTATCYERPIRKRAKPAPLPNLSGLNEPWEEQVPLPRPPPPPPPPPPPKKRLPRSYCDALAGVRTMQPYTSDTNVALPQNRQHRSSLNKKRASKFKIPEVRKTFGMCNVATAITRKKPRVVSTGMENLQFMVNGVYITNGKPKYVLGNVAGIAPTGDLIHGGHKRINGQNINIHCGYKHDKPPSAPIPCDCVKKWAGTVVKYVRRTKCYCGHNYDYGNEGEFTKKELPFFEKPTGRTKSKFNYDAIFNMDPKSIHVEKKFKDKWETDSILNENEIKKPVKKKRRMSSTCLGQNPKLEDYLKCALRYMQDVNIAAKLPDVHKAPELKDWMHRRIYGPYTQADKRSMLHNSKELWTFLELFTKRGLGVVRVPKDPLFNEKTDWCHKKQMQRRYKTFFLQYRKKVYEAHAHVVNLLWRTMNQAEVPDKNYRRTYFSYLYQKDTDIQFSQPYCLIDTEYRRNQCIGGHFKCVPDHAHDLCQIK